MPKENLQLLSMLDNSRQHEERLLERGLRSRQLAQQIAMMFWTLSIGMGERGMASLVMPKACAADLPSLPSLLPSRTQMHAQITVIASVERAR